MTLRHEIRRAIRQPMRTVVPPWDMFDEFREGAAGFLGTPLVANTSTIGGAIGEIVNQGSAEPDLDQATAGSKPTLGRYPLVPGGLGIRNRLINNMMTGAVVGAPGTAPNDWQFIQNGITGISFEVVSKDTTTGEIEVKISGTPSGTGAVAIQIAFASTTSVPASALQQWTTGVEVQITGGAATNITQFAIDNQQRNAGAFVADNITAITVNSTLTRRTATSTFSASTTTAIRPYITLGTTASAAISITLKLKKPQTELAATASAVQGVAAIYDITETGYPSVLCDYYDGGDFLSFGVAELSPTADWFTAAGHYFSGAFVVRTLTKDTTLGTAKAGATEASRTWQIKSDATSGKAKPNVRGTLTELTTTNDLTDGRFHSVIYSSDNGVVTAMIDGVYVGSGIGVGASAEEAINAIFGARTESAPASHMTGFQHNFLELAAGLSQSQMTQVHADLQRLTGCL